MDKRVRHFRTEDIHDPAEEMTSAEAVGSKGHVTVHYVDGRAVRAEIVRGGAVVQVVYYERPVSEGALLREHRDVYGAIPYRSQRPLPAGVSGMLEVFSFDAEGTLKEIDQETRDPSGELLREVRLRPDRSVIATIEYEYAPSGELASIRELNADGTLVHETRF